MEKRLLAVAGMLGVGLLLVMGRLVQLTVVKGEELARQAATQHQRRITWTPHRGAIVDRNGDPLALSVPAESLFVRPSHLPADIETYVPVLAAVLRTSPQAVNHLLQVSAPFAWLQRRATLQTAAQVRALGISGIGSVETERRFYPQGTLAAPLLGFTNVDAQGLEGIELAYDRYLRGEPAEILGERDALGRTILAQGAAVQPEALRVHLTLDASLQYLAERELDRAVRESEARAGTVVILDPQTFAVLALAQVPTFNPNAPTASLPAARRNRVISDVYEPGSTLKALLAAAALDVQLVHPEERIFCELGRYQVGKHTIHDHHPYGWLSFAQVLQYSSNIGIAKVGERLGKDVYYQYLRAFGLGHKTGIDLPGEVSGILPTLEDWAHITLITASFGHGVAVTPLQLACAFAALANDGVLMRPYVVRDVLNAEGKVVMANNPQRLWQVVRTDTARQLLVLLEKVVEERGTGRRARIDGFRVAGKTGTAQKIDPRGGYSARGRIASFVGIVPADRPRLVVLVTIDEPKNRTYGGEVAAPVFQAIARQALAYLGVEGSTAKTAEIRRPDWNNARGLSAVAASAPRQLPIRRVPEYGEPKPASSAGAVSPPNFLGLSLREAMQRARQYGWRVTATGSGYVTSQTVRRDPHSGESIYALTLAPAGEEQL